MASGSTSEVVNDVYELIYCYNASYYKVRETEEIHNRITSDPSFADGWFARMESCEVEDACLVVAEDSDSSHPSNVSDSIHVDDSQGIEGEGSNPAESYVDEGRDNYLWRRKGVLALIECYREHQEQMNDPKRKKKCVWSYVAERMKEKGEPVTGEMCDRKWRNLKKTYLTVKNNKSLSKKDRRTWEYFDVLDEIHGQENHIDPVFTFSTMSPVTEKFPNNSAVTVVETSLEENSPKKRKLATPLSDQSATNFMSDSSAPVLVSKSSSSRSKSQASRPSEEALKHTIGRPRNVVWKHYNQLRKSRSGPHYVAVCKYCGTVFNRGKVHILQKHLAVNCSQVPTDVRSKFVVTMSSYNTRSGTFKDSTDDIFDFGKPCSSSSIIEYGNEMAIRKAKESARHSSAVTAMLQIKHSIDRELLKFLVGCNLPFSIAENDFFISFVKKLRAGYNLPSRENLSNTHVFEEAARITSLTSNELSQETNLTLAVDGWTDCGKNLHAFTVLTGDHKAHLHSLMDFSEGEHTADFLTDETVKVIEAIGSRKIAAFVTDNAASMKKLRANISSRYPHILVLQCMPHYINLITEDIMKHEWVQSLLNRCLTLVAYFSQHHHQKVLLANFRESCHSKAMELRTVAKTRWYSTAVCFYSVLDNEEPLRRLMRDSGSEVEPEIKSIISSRQFWVDLGNASRLLDPLVKVVCKLEANTATVADCLHQLVSLGGTIEDLKVGSENFLDHCRAAFAERWNEVADGTYLVSYFLHPTFRGRGLAADIFPKIMEYAGNLWKSSGHGKASTVKLLRQLVKYKQEEVPYNTQINENLLPPVLLWQTLNDDLGQELKELAIKLLSITPHAVSCERKFSVLSWIHNKYRNHLQVSRLEAMGKIYVYNATHKDDSSVSRDLACGSSVKDFVTQISAADDSDEEDRPDYSQQGKEQSTSCAFQLQQSHKEVWETLRNTFDLHSDVFLREKIGRQCTADQVEEDKNSDTDFEIGDIIPAFIAAGSNVNDK